MISVRISMSGCGGTHWRGTDPTGRSGDDSLFAGPNRAEIIDLNGITV
jgi:hypothetical protein